jgi:hypothetical protein
VWEAELRRPSINVQCPDSEIISAARNNTVSQEHLSLWVVTRLSNHVDPGISALIVLQVVT